MAWGIRILGKDLVSFGAVDDVHFAQRVSQRPMHLGANGAAFKMAVNSGIMAAGLAANSEIFQMRWTHATFKMLLRRLDISAWRASATAFAAGQLVFRATHARSWSADGGAGTPIVMSTANTNKKRTDFNLSKFSDTGIRRSDTAALTAGTKTLDTNDFGVVGGFTGATAPAAGVDVAPALIDPRCVLYQRESGDEYPVLYETNEGFAIRATVPATGTWHFGINIEWAELDPTEVEGWA
jgi:hypothetical protein